ncbi:hypothetical protein Lfu02_02680 [Longispora fulva]|uniref:Flagellum-specific peptidoglycan hydrolase FlgJ n=1 Tax=Longispora fulva TaxID=619741 RepID=A0A8J7GD57_9ACTN|nr:sporangiospore maturation cell wall hydrolase GsmA [Longispora fulva]MBG6135860.1 flagellum-specific peptidoglycan hydrolase FlgJ [Longispora fulva]GIG55896.1 hypothetical protein Lfu02_02680 [Longispora fulva]
MHQLIFRRRASRARTALAALCLTLIGVAGASAVDAPARASTQTDFIAVAGPAAQRGQVEYQVPASVTVAQAILESSWGQSNLSVRDKNYFGIKCATANDPGPIAVGCRPYPTEECVPAPCHTVTASFRSYASMEDSFRDHGKLLRESARYANAFKYTTDPDRFIYEVWKAGYATDPAYPGKVTKLMRDYDLYRFNAITSSPIAVGSDGTQMILTSGGTVLAKQGIGLYGWTVETDPGVKAIATSGGVQMILTADGTVLAKTGIGLYGWTVESDPGITAIAVGGDGTQLILDASGTVWAKKGVGLYGWTQETDAVVKAIAVGSDGTQMILTTDGTVLAKQGIGLYDWTVESDPGVTAIATNGGVQVILTTGGSVLAKQGIGLYGWTVESDPGITAIAVGNDGTQLIRDGAGKVLAKKSIGLYDWTVESDAVVAAVATNAGVQLILDNSGHVLAKDTIGLYGWTVESDPIR